MKEKISVWRDREGRAVHIGPWDEAPEDVETGLYDAAGLPVLRKVATNPLPEGWTARWEWVELRADGARVPVAD